MKLTKNLKIKIIERFKAGSSLRAIEAWYPVGLARVEQVIREAMVAADRQTAPVSAEKLVAEMEVNHG